MKKLSKRTYILTAISIIMLIYLIGIYNYRKPITIHKTFSNVIVSKPDIKKISKIEINGKVYRGIYGGTIAGINLHFRNRIEGEIIIEGKEYRFSGINDTSKFINILGNVYEKNQNTPAVFWFKMEDLDSIELLRVDMSDKSGKSEYKIKAK